MKSAIILLVVAVAITGSMADCIAPYHHGCDAQNPCCNHMRCALFGGQDKGRCTHWLAAEKKTGEADDGAAECVAPYHGGCDGQNPCCNNMMCAIFEGQDKGTCTHWLAGEQSTEDVVGCTPGCEACCHSSGSRYEKHCVKPSWSDRGSCQHWLMEENEEGTETDLQDLKPGCIMAGYKGCKTSHDCCGVTGSLDGLVCGRDGVCHPLMPYPNPLPPFSLDDKQEENVAEDDGCTPGCEACCHSSGSRYEKHCVKPSWSDRGRCQHWLAEEEEELADSDYCKPGCEMCCDEDKGSQYGGFHCVPLSQSRGMCMPWFGQKEEGSKDCVVLDGCKKASDCCNKGFTCAHFAGRESGRCMPWLQEKEDVAAAPTNCVVGYGCQQASECCLENYQCLHSVGKEFGTCLPYF